MSIVYKKKPRLSKQAIAILVVFFLGIIAPFFLIFSKKVIIRFYGDIILFSNVNIIVFLVGIYLIVTHKDKVGKLTNVVRIKISGIIFVIISILIGVLFLKDYYKDIPNAINSNYAYYDGVLTNYYVSHGKSTTTNFTIGDREFSVDGTFPSDSMIKGNEYQVKYLPNSKFVISLKAKEIEHKRNNIHDEELFKVR